jgi:hypothetical protein
MPFGVKNGWPTYKKIIIITFQEYINMFMKILFDDFIVFIDLPTSYRSSGNVSLSIKILGMLQPHFGLSVRVKPTLPKVGTWSPSGLPKTQSPS